MGLNAPDGEREKLVAPVKLEGPVEVRKNTQPLHLELLIFSQQIL